MLVPRQHVSPKSLSEQLPVPFSYILPYNTFFMHNCPVKGCLKTCKSAYGLTQHVNAVHQHLPQHFRSKASSRKWIHPFLTGKFNGSTILIYVTILTLVVVQLAPVIEAATISLQMPIPHHLNLWMLLLKTLSTHSQIVLLSNSLIFTSPNSSVPRQVLTEPWTSGKLKLKNMDMARMCLGIRPGICMPRLTTYGRGIIHGHVFRFIIKASYHQTRLGG